MEQINITKIIICIISLVLSTLYKWAGSTHRTGIEFGVSLLTCAAAIFLMLLLTEAIGVDRSWSYVLIFLSGLSGKPFIKIVCDRLEEYVKTKYPPEDPKGKK